MLARQEPPLAFPMAEAAATLRVSKAHLYRLIARGELRSTKIGGSRRVPRSEVERLAGMSLASLDGDQ
jgi:excisionase family DNA binding protein